MSSAYGWGELSAEMAYGTPELGVQAVLRGMFREGSGVGVRGALGWPWKGFLAGHMGVCPCREPSGSGILRSVLRTALRPVLRAI
jgi:hypothetical protein